MAILYKKNEICLPNGRRLPYRARTQRLLRYQQNDLAALRGQDIRGGIPPQYGYDDMNMSGLDHRIQKQNIEDQLKTGPQEFSEEEFSLIPKSVAEKFGFKKKAPKNDESKTTLQTPNPEAQNPAATILPTLCRNPNPKAPTPLQTHPTLPAIGKRSNAP